MSNSFNLRRNVTTSVFTFGANLVLVFITYRLVAQQGGVAAVGLWSALMAWIFVIRLGDVGMSNAALRFAARCDAVTETDKVRRYVDTAVLMNSVLFVALALGGWAVYARNLELILPGAAEARETARSILPLLFSAFVLQNLGGLVMGSLRAVHRGYVAAWLSLAGTVVQLVIVVPMVPKIGLAGLAWGMLAQHALILFGGWALFLAVLRDITGKVPDLLPRNASMRTVGEMLGFSIKSQVANLANGFFEPLSKIVISRFAGIEVLGLYEMAFKLVSLPRNTVVSGVQASIPTMTRLMATDRTAARALYSRALRISMRNGGMVLAAVLLISPMVSWYWLGEISPKFEIFAGLIAVGFLVNLSGATAYALGTASGRLKGNILAAMIANAITATLAVAIGAMEGPDWAMVLAISVALSAAGLYVRRTNERLLSEPA
ncbi:MAG: oligosaccharide flippase family protein [Marivita sp.]